MYPNHYPDRIFYVSRYNLGIYETTFIYLCGILGGSLRIGLHNRMCSLKDIYLFIKFILIFDIHYAAWHKQNSQSQDD